MICELLCESVARARASQALAVKLLQRAHTLEQPVAAGEEEDGGDRRDGCPDCRAGTWLVEAGDRS
eukprot:SAG31_NODE_2258_length_6069_cov_21.781072_10_plen_66_part_00